MKDTIYRQDAIEALGDIHPLDYNAQAYKARIEKLPSAEPEYWFDEWCTDCKEYDHERHCCPRFNRVIRSTLQEVQAEQPDTLYGYSIEHLALIAKIMQKEGVTPEKAIEYFTNIDKMVQMIRDEEKELLDRALRWSEGKEV